MSYPCIFHAYECDPKNGECGYSATRKETMAARDSISDGKYIVFKVDDFYRFIVDVVKCHHGEKHSKSVEEMALENNVVLDATVIRDQDVFAAPTLYSYANSIRTAIEVCHSAGILDLKAIERLQNKADFFMDRAERARDALHKLPD